jgi:uncharacterized protein YdaT
MPWTPAEFKAKHNKKLSPAAAKKAAAQANALLKRGLPEGEAIAIANKRFGAMAGKRKK